MTGIGNGFFVPLFFVVLGARIDVRALAHGSLIAFAALLVVFNVVLHLAAAALTKQPLAAGLAATVQLGVPAAVASLGLQAGVVSPGAAAAIMAAALVSIAVSGLGVSLLDRKARARYGVRRLSVAAASASATSVAPTVTPTSRTNRQPYGPPAATFASASYA